MKSILSLIAAIACLAFTGCNTLNNVTTTKFSYTDPETGGVVTVEMPKEINAENMNVTMNAKEGVVNITATKWISQNQGTLNAEAAREVAVVHEIMSGAGAIVGSAAKTAVLPGAP